MHKHILSGTVAAVLFSVNLFAQVDFQRADSALSAFQSDESSDFRSQIEFGDSLMLFFKKHQRHCQWMETAIRKSHYQSVVGDDNEALTTINAVFKGFQSKLCERKSLLPEIHLAYARIYINMGLDIKAGEYLQKGFESWQEDFPNKSTLAGLYAYKGGLFQNLDSAVHYLTKALQIARQANDLKYQQGIQSDIGYTYAIHGLFEKATLYFKEALKVARQRKAYVQVSTIYNNLAGVSSDTAKIAQYLDSAFYYAARNGNLDAMQTARQNAALFYYENSAFEKGYSELWKSMRLKDSLYNRDKIRAFAEIEQKYQSELKEQEIQFLNTRTESRTKQRNGLIAVSALLIILAALLLLQRNKIAQERKRSDVLLLNILPSEIAEELKEKGQAEARSFEKVSILFTDFVQFTQTSEKLSARDLVAEINVCFKAFDQICDKYKIEKIKTIGDAFMAAGGLPLPTDDSVKNTVMAALEMQEFIDARHKIKDARGEPAFEMRVGIHTGPVVAGIVGVKKFQYDIWGDTVNTASRMESAGEVAKVNISQGTYELLKEDRDFKFDSRGKIEAKGKGEMEMWFVSSIE